MSLTRDDIDLAYKLFLGRQPSEAEAERMLTNQTSLDGLRRVFLNSDEFRKKHRGGGAANDTHQTLIHLHVPKTAGSSLSRLLVSDTTAQQRMTLGDGDLNRLRTLPPTRMRELKLIFGHLSHGVGRLVPHRCHYVSVLREPGPRILSFFRYVGRTDHHPLYRTVTERNMSFGDFLEFTAANPKFRLEVDNGQIRRLGGRMALATLGRERFYLRRALHNVFAPNFTYGLTEHFNGFQNRLVQRGLLSATMRIHENAAPDPGKLDEALAVLTPEQRAIYDSYIAWDSQLYTICKSVYFSHKIAKEPRT